MEEDDIDLLVKHTLKAQVVPAEGALITILYNAVVKLKAFHYFAVLSERIGQPACSQDFTMEMLEFVQEVKKERHDHKNVADESPMKPRALKSLGKWHTWWEKFDGYLSQTTGAVEIGLNYIYQAHQQVTDEMHAADYVMNDDHYYMITVLEGAHYREDNKHMYEELQALTIDGPGWTFIKNFQRARNGHAAILALKAQSKGWSATETRKQEAYALLALAHYAGLHDAIGCSRNMFSIIRMHIRSWRFAMKPSQKRRRLPTF